MTNPTLERVARAICEKADGDPNWVTRNALWRGDKPPVAWETYLDAARAALLALKEVDEGTVEAMDRAAYENCGGEDIPTRSDLIAAFTAAIDHILEQGS